MSSAVTSLGNSHSPSDIAGPSRPVARRTYGRQRATTPTDATDTTSVFVSHALAESPSKVLLGRWHHNSSTWKDSLSALGSSPEKRPQQSAGLATTFLGSRPGLTDFGLAPAQPPTSASIVHDAEGDDEDDSAEIVQLELERMRREARGVPDSSKRETLTPGVHDRVMVALCGSSSLTDLPTSDTSSPPSSSNLLANDEDRINGHGKVKTMSRVAQLAAQRRAATMQVGNEDDDDTTLKRISISRSSPSMGTKRDTSLRRTFGDQSDGDGGSKDSLEGEGDKLPDFWADIVQSQTEHPSDHGENDTSMTSINVPSNRTSSAGLFNDDSDTEVALTKGKKIRPLSKRDTKLMQSGMAEGRRNRQVEVNKVKGDQRPLSQWLTKVEKMMADGSRIKDENPGLSFKKDSSPRTSPSQKTPADSIVAFTPRASEMRDIPRSDSEVLIGDTPSSPTRQTMKLSDAPDDLRTHKDGMQPVEAMFAAEQTRRAKEERLKSLKERKAALVSMRWARKQEPALRQALVDEDFEVLPASADHLTKVEHEAKPKRTESRAPDAKAILNRAYTSTSPALSKNKQRILQQAGKLSRSKNNTVTETFAEFAGKTWKHAELKHSDGGAKPAERKDGRDNRISKEQLDHMNLLGHTRQSLMLRQKKEEEWNRGSKPLPPKRQHNFAALVAANSSQPAEDDDSDADDDEFVPDADDAMGEDDEDDDLPNYSGEDGEGHELSDNVDGQSEEETESQQHVLGDDAMADDAPSSHSDTDKENDPGPTKSSKMPAWAMSGSNDEATPKAHRKPLSNIQPPSPTLPSVTPTLQSRPASFAQQVEENNDILFTGGMGGDGEGGFSQLFEDTQTDEIEDPFAGLRDRGDAALLDGYAMLPGVDLSETQAARDNALIAGELEAARASQPLEFQPKKRYLNDKGYFTQTKPSDHEVGGLETQMINLRKALAGPSDILSDIRESSQSLMLSSTEKDSSSVHPATSSPTKRIATGHHRRSSSPALAPRISPKQKRTQEDILQRMMRAERRREKHAAESKAAVKSNWIDNQAEESDEDGGWAPIGAGESDEEEEGDEEGYIADLVDDQTIDDDERRRQDELAALKMREVQAADDAKREAEARKIIQGEHRVKRKGADFFSDDDEDDGNGKRRKWSKKERRKRKLEREDGLDKLDGEANVFKEAYDRDLDSDFSDVEPDEPLISIPLEESLQPARPMYEILRERARIQREKRPDEELDLELGLNDAGFDIPPQQKVGIRAPRPILVDTDDESDNGMLVDEPEEESQFSISRGLRSAASINLDQVAPNRRLSAQRTSESYAQYVRDEAQVTRRAAGAAGVSVVVQKSFGYTGVTASRHHTHPRAPSRQSTTSSSTSGGILMSKGNRFA